MNMKPVKHVLTKIPQMLIKHLKKSLIANLTSQNTVKVLEKFSRYFGFFISRPDLVFWITSLSADDLAGETDYFCMTRVSVISVFGRAQTGIFTGGMPCSSVEISCGSSLV